MKNKADLLKFKAVKTALLDGKVILIIDFKLFNHKNSPFFNPWENVLPLIFITIFALIMMFSSSILTGMIILLLGFTAYLKFFPLIMYNTMKQRVFLSLTKSIQEWDKNWINKGIIIKVADNPYLFCKSPDDDWREFVVINFADLMVN